MEIQIPPFFGKIYKNIEPMIKSTERKSRVERSKCLTFDLTWAVKEFEKSI